MIIVNATNSIINADTQHIIPQFAEFVKQKTINIKNFRKILNTDGFALILSFFYIILNRCMKCI